MQNGEAFVKWYRIFGSGLWALLLVTGAWASENAYPYQDIGDGKKATEVPLSLVDGIAVDSEGTIYISHRSKNRIRKIDKEGTITTIAGNGHAGFGGDSGPALEAPLNFPAGLCVDLNGNIFVADRNNHRVRKIDSGGVITTVAGDGTRTQPRSSWASGLNVLSVTIIRSIVGR